MTLTNEQIERYSKAPKPLISPFEGANNRGGSYDLTIGDEYYVGSAQDESVLDTSVLENGQSFAIPPHAVCFVLLAEEIILPRDITAKVSLRMTHIYSGLVVTSQPPFDPGYTGKVIIMVHNFSTAPVYLKRGDRIATIEFTKLESESTITKPHRSVDNLRGQLNKPLVSSLSEIANISKAAKDRVDWLSNQMLIFAALIVAVLAVPGFFSYNGLVDRFNEQRDQVKELKISLDEYKTQNQKNTEEMSNLKKRLSAYEAASLEKQSDEASPLKKQPAEVSSPEKKPDSPTQEPPAEEVKK